MTKIKLIAFDIFGVIITEGHMISSVLMPLLTEGTDKAKVKKFYELYTIGKIEEKQFWSAIQQTGNDNLRETFLNSFRLDDHFKIIQKQLSHSFDIALLSNVPVDWFTFLNQKYRFDATFSPNIISGVLQCRKPEEGIYHQLILHSNKAAHEIAFIDDRLENLEMAHKLGMTTIHLKKESDEHAFSPDFTIHNLNQLPELSCLTETV